MEGGGSSQADSSGASFHSVRRACVGSQCYPGHFTPWSRCIGNEGGEGSGGTGVDSMVNWNPMSRWAGQSWSPWDTALVRVWSSMATSKQISFLLGLIAFLFQIFYVGTRKITIVVQVVHHTRALHQSEHLSHQRQHRFTYV